MKLIKSSYEILTDLSDPMKILKDIEKAGRTCYKSENRITDDSCIQFCKSLINRGHEAVIEHSQLSVKFIVDRGISHEIVRHRLFSFAQESTRYCNYSKDKFGKEIKVISLNDYLDSDSYRVWYDSCMFAEHEYFALLEKGVKPEIARGVLPTSLATEIVVTGNIREWRHFFKLRSSYNVAAHPQIKSISDMLLKDLQCKIPVLFDDIKI